MQQTCKDANGKKEVVKALAWSAYIPVDLTRVKVELPDLAVAKSGYAPSCLPPNHAVRSTYR